MGFQFEKMYDTVASCHYRCSICILKHNFERTLQMTKTLELCRWKIMNNLRHTDNITLLTETKEDMQQLLGKVRKES